MLNMCSMVLLCDPNPLSSYDISSSDFPLTDISVILEEIEVAISRLE